MSLLPEFEYYRANQDQLVEQYGGRVIVIKEQQVIGVYDSERQAVDETVKTHELGTFLVQRCGPGEDNYTFTFHTPRLRNA